MSLPNHNRETLLSAALDGELTAQEQADFDREIAADASFAHEFDELQTLRTDLQSCFSELRKQKLSPGAADRIVAAAIAESPRSGISRPPVSPAALDDGSDKLNGSTRIQWIAATLALAASMLIAVTLWNRDETNVPPRNSFAKLDAESKPSVADRVPTDRNTAPDIASSLEPRTPDVVAIAANQPKVTTDLESAEEPTVAPKVMGIKPNGPAVSDSNSIASSSPKSEASSIDRQPLNVVLVLSVELTQAGRDQLALQEALRSTDIRLGENSVMGNDVVSHLQSANVIDSTNAETTNGAKLFFIEASAKRIDRFMNHLMSNPDLFASVGLGLATEPPLLAAVGELREFDPTKIRQDGNVGIARDIVSADRRSLSIDSQYPFIPLSSDVVDSGILQSSMAPAGSSDASESAVEDFPSQLLLLVK